MKIMFFLHWIKFFDLWKDPANQPSSNYLGKFFMNHKRDHLDLANGDAFSCFMVLALNSGDGPPWFCASLLTQSCHSTVLSCKCCFCHFLGGGQCISTWSHSNGELWRQWGTWSEPVQNGCLFIQPWWDHTGCSVSSSELPTWEHWSSSIEEGYQDT